MLQLAEVNKLNKLAKRYGH